MRDVLHLRWWSAVVGSLPRQIERAFERWVSLSAFFGHFDVDFEAGFLSSSDFLFFVIACVDVDSSLTLSGGGDRWGVGELFKETELTGEGAETTSTPRLSCGRGEAAGEVSNGVVVPEILDLRSIFFLKLMAIFFCGGGLDSRFC